MEKNNAVMSRRPVRRRHKFPKFTLPRQLEIFQYAEWGPKRAILSKMLPRFDDYWVVDQATEDHMTAIAKRVDSTRNGCERGLLYNLYLSPGHLADGIALPIVERLLGLGIDPDPEAFDGRTPLSQAAAVVPCALQNAQVLVHCRPKLSIGITLTAMVRARTCFAVRAHVRRSSPAADDDDEQEDFEQSTMDYWTKTIHVEAAKTIAQLACEKKWYAVKNLCRRRVVSEEEKLAKHEGRDAIEWAEVHGEAMMAEELRYLLKPVVSAGATITEPAAGDVGARAVSTAELAKDESTSGAIRRHQSGDRTSGQDSATSKKRQRKQ